ncbi:hypothetical protein C7999DRAFT_34623 [Corynascus novoguineensis]|uniref:Uncharacterized protein n=1 Tax=Corynascus novoguineensis TaxID=1126955 RepID=A0AAN7HCS0_9PEZI|nr:hypothetical protein C7999DRAFT_34623 [Corynascus novoguineensis]
MTDTKNDILLESELYDEFDELKPGWRPLLDDKLRVYSDPDSEHHFDCILASLIKEFLLWDDDGAATVFAQRFDDLYSTVYEPRFNGYRGRKKGWTGYLLVFYQTLCQTAVQIRYDDPKQERLVRLLVELGKLPSRSVKVFVQSAFGCVDTKVWSSHLLLPYELRVADPGEMYPDVFGDLAIPENLQSLERASVEYVNFHTFNARCIAAGLDTGLNGPFASEGPIISVGLNPGDHSFKAPWVDCLVMAAAQYIIIAGDVIDAECVKKQAPPDRWGWKGWENGNGPSLWKHWATKLGEIADTLLRGEDPGFRMLEGNRGTLTDMVIKARDKMVALEPELLVQSDSDPATEAKTETQAQIAGEAQAH